MSKNRGEKPPKSSILIGVSNIFTFSPSILGVQIPLFLGQIPMTFPRNERRLNRWLDGFKGVLGQRFQVGGRRLGGLPKSTRRVGKMKRRSCKESDFSGYIRKIYIQNHIILYHIYIFIYLLALSCILTYILPRIRTYRHAEIHTDIQTDSRTNIQMFHYIALHYIAVHLGYIYVTLHFDANLHYTTMQYSVIQCNAIIRYHTIQYSTIQYNTI